MKTVSRDDATGVPGFLAFVASRTDPEEPPMRRLTVLSLIAAPALLLTSELVSPDLSDNGTESLAVVAAQPGRLSAWIWLGIASAVLFVPAVTGVARLLRRRGGVAGGVGAALAVVGAFGYAVHQGLFLQLPALVEGDPAEMAALYERQGESAAVAVVTFLLFLGPLMIGLLLLGIGLHRSGVAPLWPAVAIALAVLPSAVPLPVDVAFAPFVLLIAGMAGWAAAVLRGPRAGELVAA
ncbi:hypothetical protein GCM10010531_40190 [Blastococcus jejuensis]|uniref:Sec-independent protein translocase protein TatC n=1 Tax=Blastococcus jejuensis TaxID=351224 RepID=A0ABP6PKT2_9ACTN